MTETSALLNFLQKNLVEPTQEEKMTLEADLHIALSSTSSDEDPSFSEMIENYRYLLGLKGPVQMEKMLMEAFDLKEFSALGLAPSFPRIYRGLPRLYHKDHPAQSHIKKNFTHLPTLKKLAADKAIFSLYDSFEIHAGTMSLFTCIVDENLTTYWSALEALQIAKDRFPHLELHLVLLVSANIKLPPSTICPIHRIPCESDQPLPWEVLKVLRDSDLILQMSSYYPFNSQLTDLLKGIDSEKSMPRMELLGGYGFLESSWLHPKMENRSLGLHFLEKGVFIGNTEKVRPLENPDLRQWMTDPSRPFYLADLITPVGGAVYLHALLKSRIKENRDIDICTPDLRWLIKYVEKQHREGLPILVGDLSVSSLDIYYEGAVHTIETGLKGKKVRLLCPKALSSQDFTTLMHLSEDFVAVQGDYSFSRAISANKVFFYDGAESSRYFIKDLLALAENRIGSHRKALLCLREMGRVFLHHLPRQEGVWIDEVFFQEAGDWIQIAHQIGHSLGDQDVVVGYKKLNQIIANEFSCNAFLCRLIQRAFCHHQFLDVEYLEAEQTALFAADALSFSNLFRNLKKSLKF